MPITPLGILSALPDCAAYIVTKHLVQLRRTIDRILSYDVCFAFLALFNTVIVVSSASRYTDCNSCLCGFGTVLLSENFNWPVPSPGAKYLLPGLLKYKELIS